MEIGFYGTGLMGAPMVVRLLKAGYSIGVYNRTIEKAKVLSKFGAVVFDSPLKLAQQSDTIIVMLSDNAAIKQVLFSNDEINFKNKTFIQMSTISPNENIDIKVLVEKDGGEFVEAPVLGSIPQVKNGELFVLISGTVELFSKWKPLFETFGNRIIYFGEYGKASAAKLALNQLIASLTAAFSMSLGYILEKGVDVNTFMEVLRKSALYAPTFDKKLDRMQKRDFSNPNFPLRHLLKDINLIIDDFDDNNINTILLKGVKTIISEGLKNNLSDSDYSALYNIIHKVNNSADNKGK